MRVRLHPKAVLEIEAAHDYHESSRPGLGGGLEAEIARSISRIRAMPLAFPQWRNQPRIRACHLTRFRLILPFAVARGEVVVLALAHTRRAPGYWLNRLTDGS